MTDFNALLTRSFAEAGEPADNGFSVSVSARVARRVSDQKLRSFAQGLGLAAAGAAIVYAGVGFMLGGGQDVLATAGLEVARAHDAIAEAPDLSNVGQGMLQSLGVGLTQILLAAAALVGGAVAYRASQE
jgi:hypothetical protein